MSIVELDGSPSWSFDASETGESIFPLLQLDTLNPIASSQGHFARSPVSLASRNQDGGLSKSTIDVYNPAER